MRSCMLLDNEIQYLLNYVHTNVQRNFLNDDSETNLQNFETAAATASSIDRLLRIAWQENKMAATMQVLSSKCQYFTSWW